MPELEARERPAETRSSGDHVRAGVRRVVEALGTASGFTGLVRKAMSGRTAIIAYHNVVAPQDAGRGDTSLHLPLPEFIRQIERLARTHDIVDLDSAARQQRYGRPRAIITFDDAYRGAVTLALPELARRSLPAVVFVSPGLLGDRITWWDALAEAGHLSEQRRARALENLGGRTDRIMEHFRDRVLPELPASYGIATEDELYRHCIGNIRVGSHTWAHEFLPALSISEIHDTLAHTQDWIQRFNGPKSNWLALPYGGGAEEIAKLAHERGHAGVLGIEGGLWQPRDSRAIVPRINVPAGMSWRGLELRTSGVLPS